MTKMDRFTKRITMFFVSFSAYVDDCILTDQSSELRVSIHFSVFKKLCFRFKVLWFSESFGFSFIRGMFNFLTVFFLDNILC